MIKYVLLISLIFTLLFYIFTIAVFDIENTNIFTINYIFGYLIMLLNFLYMSKRIMKTEKIHMFFYTSIIRLFIISLLLYLWIQYGMLDIIGLSVGLIIFITAIPIGAFVYIKLGEKNGTLH